MTYGIIAAAAIIGAIVAWCFCAQGRWHRLEALTAGRNGTRFWWDGPFPILTVDASKASSDDVNEILNQVRRCAPRLLEVNIDGADDAHSAALGRLHTLEKLYLTGPNFTGIGLRQLAELRRLEVLKLESCPIADADLVILLGLSELVELHIEGTNVTAGGLATLQGLPMLKDVTLNDVEHPISKPGRP